MDIEERLRRDPALRAAHERTKAKVKARRLSLIHI